MTYLEEIASDQLDSIDKSTEQHSLLTSFEGFLELLIDLNIVSTSNSSSDLVRYSDDQLVELEGFENSFSNSFEPESIEAEAKPLTCELISSQQQLKLEDALETWAVLDTPEATPTCASPKIKPKPFLLPGSKETFEQNDTGIEKKSVETKTEDPLELLQNLLSDPQVAKCRHSVIGLEQKVARLESEIYQPEQLIDLLLPVISELLRRKVVSSQSKEIAAAIAPEIAAAIEQQIIIKRSAIANAIAPEMGIAIKQQITLERDAMVDALYPVIGSTIAKYMAEAIRSINEKIENSLSPQGIIRKFRAKLQGVSEAELILKEAMPFSVQAIFLIHKSSGLVIGEVQSGSQHLESEMVAGMLTAIRSFVNDCIAHTGDSEVHTIEYGNSKIILEVAGYCYLAAVIDGEPPQSFIRKMQQTLAAIIQNYGESVESFEGDSTTIPEQINSLLEQLKPTSSKSTKSTPIPLIIGSVLSLILLPWGFFQYRHLIDSRIQTDTAFALASTPELAVYRLTVNVNQGNLKLSGMLPNQYLRQKAEQIAQEVAPNLKLDNKILAVDIPPDPVLATAEVKRVTSILNQMDGIAITANYAKRLVSIQGTVNDFSDAEKITHAFKQIPGVHSVTNTIELSLPSTIRFYFDSGSTRLKPADIVKIISLKQFLNRHPEKHLKIIGHSVSNGDRLVNQQLALKRALSVQNALSSQGIDLKRMQIVGTITPQSAGYNQPIWLSRYVEFKLVTPSISK